MDKDKIYMLKKAEQSWYDFPFSDLCSLIFYFIGCEHNCKNCQNKELQSIPVDKSNLMSFSVDKPEEFFNSSFLNNSWVKEFGIKNIILQGGEPLHEQNLFFTKSILKYNKEVLNSYFNFMVYTGYEFEYCVEKRLEFFELLKTGNYLEQHKQKVEADSETFTLASTNQKIYDKYYNLLSCNGVLKKSNYRG